jgi:amino acid permease
MRKHLNMLGTGVLALAAAVGVFGIVKMLADLYNGYVLMVIVCLVVAYCIGNLILDD